jgi:hypothetical protein
MGNKIDLNSNQGLLTSTAGIRSLEFPSKASPAPRDTRIEQGYERTGVDEDHRPIFCCMASFAARFASAAGVRDQPPAPRSRRR